MKTSQLEKRLGADVEFSEELVRKNHSPDLFSMIAEYMSRSGITRSELIMRLDLDRNYGYQLLNGTRKPTRNHLIKIGLVLGVGSDDMQRLLKAGNKKPLYVRDMFDAKVYYALKHKMSYNDAAEFIWKHDS